VDADDRLSDEIPGALAATLVPGAGSLAAPVLKFLAKESRRELKRLRSRALKAAERTSGLTREELSAQIVNEPRLVPLATRVLFEAGMTGQDEILDALGAALGEAARAPERCDELESVLIGIARIRRAHIKVLRALGPDRPRAGDGREVTWGGANAAEKVAIDEETVRRLLADLAAAGFMTGWSAFDDLGYTVNALGLALLEVLDQYAG